MDTLTQYNILYLNVISFLSFLFFVFFLNKGTAFVVYEDIYDAKSAVDHLSGFNVGGRYLVVLYYQPAKFEKKKDVQEKQKELDELRKHVKAKKDAMTSSSESS